MAGEKLVNLPIILFQYSLFNIQNNHNEHRTSTIETRPSNNEKQYIQTKQTTGGSRKKQVLKKNYLLIYFDKYKHLSFIQKI